MSNERRAPTTTPPSLFSLPLELRRLIYQHYLHDLFLDENPNTDKIGHVPLLQVNAQVNVEDQESLKKPNEGLDIELSWQGVRINSHSVSGMRYRSGRKKWHMNAPPYLRVKIFALYLKRPTDIICLWYHAKALCDQLHEYLRIPRLIIDFEESIGFTQDLPYHFAPPSWSKARDKGLSKKSIEHEETDYGNCDAYPQCFCRKKHL